MNEAYALSSESLTVEMEQGAPARRAPDVKRRINELLRRVKHRWRHCGGD